MSATTQTAHSFDADEPIQTDRDDKYHFTQIADKFASTLLTHDLQKGIVIGITAPWGSGKTSLLNLITNSISSIEDDGTDTEPVILRFSPWLVGNHEVLLSSFLPLLAKTVSNHNTSKVDLKQLFKYATIVSTGIQNVNTLVNMTTGVKIPLLNEVLALGDDVLSKFYEKNDTKGLDQIKEEANKALLEAKVPVIVLLDDIDRLEPKEVLDMLRLVRSTARFPYVSYILTYDEEKVVQIIDKGLGTDGADYLNKIRQLTIRVPNISPVLLTNSLQDRLGKLLTDSDEEHTKYNDSLASTILKLATLDILRLPRDVSRLYNEFLLMWLMNKDSVNPVDLIRAVALQAKHKNLHRWVMDYMKDYYRVISEIGYIDPNDISSTKLRYSEELKLACDKDRIDIEFVCSLLEELVPGFAFTPLDTTDQTKDSLNYEIECFNECSPAEISSFKENRKLASREYWRYYFNYYDGVHFFSSLQVREFIHRTEKKMELALQEFLQYGKESDSREESRAEVLIDEILTFVQSGQVPVNQKSSILDLLAESIDPIARELTEKQIISKSLFIKSQNLAIEILKELPSQNRLHKVRSMIESGKSISWIMFLFRRIVFFGERIIDDFSIDESSWFTPRDIEDIRTYLQKRVDKFVDERDWIFGMLAPKWFFYTWLDLSDESAREKLKNTINEFVREDNFFIRFIHCFTTIRVSSSDGEKIVVDFTDIKRFVDIDNAVARLERIVESNEHLAGDASKILEMYKSR